jgi:hypothetical protein
VLDCKCTLCVILCILYRHLSLVLCLLTCSLSACINHSIIFSP